MVDIKYEKGVLKDIYFLQTCSMACCPSSNIIVCGTTAGFVYFIEATTVEQPRIISCFMIHKGPVLHLW